MMNLIDEVREFLPVKPIPPKVRCKVYEDTASCIKVAEAPMMTPRTKHIALKYHHFRYMVNQKRITIEHCRTENMTAEIFSKPLPDVLFRKHRLALMGW